MNPIKDRYFYQKAPRKLTNGDGWVFSKGIAGKWVGKTIAEPLVAQDEGPDSSNEALGVGNSGGVREGCVCKWGIRCFFSVIICNQMAIGKQ
jgi:hypothetical protein